MEVKTIIGICGSIRQHSSSHVILEEIVRMLPAEIVFEAYDNLASVPAFDDREEDPEPVKDFKAILKKADGIFISSPEYAFGVPGALKNALDWTVGTGDFFHKPVALVTASSQGVKAHESMQYILAALAAELYPKNTLLISNIRSKVKDGRVADDETRQALQALVTSFVTSLKTKSVDSF